VGERGGGWEGGKGSKLSPDINTTLYYTNKGAEGEKEKR